MDYKRHAVILGVVEELNKSPSWTGKTHVQKALFLLGEFTNTDVPFQFVLYKHGPYSFEVEAAMVEMMSYGALQSIPVSGYGPMIRPGEGAGFVHKAAPLTEPTERLISDVCTFLGPRGVEELEAVATAAWVYKREGKHDAIQIINGVRELKPHIAEAKATEAVAKFLQWIPPRKS